MNNNIGVYWFTNDLRINDNPLLQRASVEVDALISVYCYPEITPFLGQYAQEAKLGYSRQQFLNQSLDSLNGSLTTLSQSLIVITMPLAKAISILKQQVKLTHLYVNEQAGSYELQQLDLIQTNNPSLQIVQKEVNCLFPLKTLPFQINALPETFSQFRKKVENIVIDINLNHVDSLPPMPSEIDVSPLKIATLPLNKTNKPVLFKGGEQAALKHCQTYFETTYPSRYKETRNALDGFDNSTKFSPWLALGCISPTMIYAMLKQYEKINGANESTYWIYFELLWREYFYWYARRYQNALFHFGGIRNKPPLTSFYAQRFQQWKHGQTPFPIVNACMHQLNQTGYMSNRGRQLVASCLVHELNLDWRYGAAYFETQLIDYDVASNWGNWQYLAGVGADPRGSRRFNLTKQTQVYDPDLEFISQWRGVYNNPQIDIQDYVDWPITSATYKGDT